MGPPHTSTAYPSLLSNRKLVLLQKPKPDLTSKQQSVNVDTKLAFVAKQKQSTLLASVWWTQYPDLISHKGHEGDLKIVWLTHPVIYLTKAPQQHLCILPKGHYNVILTFKDIFYRSQDNASGVEGKIPTSTHIHWVFGAVATKNGILNFKVLDYQEIIVYSLMPLFKGKGTAKYSKPYKTFYHKI